MSAFKLQLRGGKKSLIVNGPGDGADDGQNGKAHSFRHCGWERLRAKTKAGRGSKRGVASTTISFAEWRLRQRHRIPSIPRLDTGVALKALTASRLR